MKTNVLYLFLLISFLFSSCKNDKSKEKEVLKTDAIFQITANTKGFSPTTIVLQSKIGDAYSTILTAKKDKDDFVIESNKELPISTYYLKIDTDKTKIPVLIDNTDIMVKIDPSDISKSVVTGNSELQKKYNQYKMDSKEAKNLFYFQKEIISKHSNNYFGVIVLNEMLGPSEWRLGQAKLLFEKLDKKMQTTTLGKSISDYIVKGLVKIDKDPTDITEIKDPKPAGLPEITTVLPTKKKEKVKNTPSKPKKKTSKHHITAYAPYFYAHDLNGTEHSAKTIFNKNKIILIDFWASWCAPCRAQNPDLVRLYDKYHSKGFEIISISQDSDSNNCTAAISQDNMNWINLIDNHTAVANMFHVNTIPNAFLVNSQGGIIAKNLGSGRLETLLIKEFGF